MTIMNKDTTTATSIEAAKRFHELREQLRLSMEAMRQLTTFTANVTDALEDLLITDEPEARTLMLRHLGWLQVAFAESVLLAGREVDVIDQITAPDGLLVACSVRELADLPAAVLHFAREPEAVRGAGVEIKPRPAILVAVEAVLDDALGMRH